MAAGRSPGTGRPAPGQTPRPRPTACLGRPSPRPTALTCSVRTGLCPPVPPARFAFALSAPPSPTCCGPPAPACSPQLTCFAGAAHLAAPAGQVQRPRMARPGQEGSTGRGHPLCPLCASPERRWREKGEGRVPWGARGLTLPAPGGQCRPPTILSAPPTVPRAQALRTEENVAVSVPTGLPEAGQGRQQSGTTSGSPRVGSVRRLRRRSQQARRPGGRGSSGEKHSCHPRSTDNGCLFFWPKEAAAGLGGFPGMVGVGAGDGVRGVEWRGHAPSRQDCAGVWVPTH